MIREKEMGTKAVGVPRSAVVDDVAAGLAAEPFDFSDVMDHPENASDPEFVIRPPSRYAAQVSALACELLLKAARQGKVGEKKPHYVIISRLKGDDSVIVITPTRKRSSATAPVNWFEGGSRARVSLRQLFMIKRFPIPRGNVAHIPVTADTVDDLGPSLLLHLDETRFVPTRSPAGRKSRSQVSQQPVSPAAGSPAASAAPEKTSASPSPGGEKQD